MAERTTVEYVYEYWDCPRCGRKAIRGDRDKCPDCGFNRDDSITFYRMDVDEVIYDEKQIEEFMTGPDWICSFCQTMNSQTEEKCAGCGVAKSDAEKNYFDILEKRRQKEAMYAAQGSNTIADEAAAQEAAEGGGKGGSKSNLFKIIGGAAAGVALLVGLFSWGFSSKAVEYKVTAVQWERTIPVLRYSQQQRQDWSDQLKGDDIKKIADTRKVRDYEKKQVGTKTEQYEEEERYQSGTKEECTTSYESTGSGAAKKVTKCRDVPVYSTRTVTKTREVPVYEDVPIYGTWVTYTSKDYGIYRTLEKEGADNRPVWPEFTAGTGLDGKPDREGEKAALYQVTLKKQDADAKGPEAPVVHTTESLFTTKYINGKIVEMKVNNFGTLSLEDGEKMAGE